MSKLLLSDEEKDFSWGECPDELLANIARYWLVHFNQAALKTGPDTGVVLATAASLSLIRMAHELNAETYEVLQEGVTVSGGDIGDWVVSVRKKR